MKGIFSFLILWIPVLGVIAQGRDQGADLIISHAKVISPPDVVIENANIVIVGNKIDYIGSGTVKRTAKRYIDAGGRAVIPGMIDAHMHLGGKAVMGGEPTSSEQGYREWVSTEASEKLRDYLRHGFTTVLSLADYWPGILQVRDKIATGEFLGPHLLIAGPMISPPNGHLIADTDCMFAEYCAKYGPVRAIADEEQGRALVRELARAHVDGIKIAYEPAYVAFNTGRQSGRFAPGVFKALVEEAHGHQLPVWVHAYPVSYALEAMQLGVDGLAHGPGLVSAGATAEQMKEFIKVAKEKSIPINTTLADQTVYPDLWGSEQFVSFGGTQFVDMVKQGHALERSRQDVMEFTRNGLMLAFGTDILGIKWPGDAARLELQRLSESGLSPMQVLTVVTLNAAKFVRKEDEIGSIARGKRADMVIIAGDPLRNIDCLNRVDMTIKDGRIAFDYFESRP